MSALQAAGLFQGGSVQETGPVSGNAATAQSDAFKIMSLIRAFYMYGHLAADLDPLGLDEVYSTIDKTYLSRAEH